MDFHCDTTDSSSLTALALTKRFALQNMAISGEMKLMMMFSHELYFQAYAIITLRFVNL